MFIRELQRIIFNRKYESGVDVMSEDWDNLLILDACRYDIFKQENYIDGKLENRISKGAHSSEFIEKNFLEEKFHDTVYVTGNPNSTKLSEDNFYTVIHAIEEWDPEAQTVLPEDIVKMTLRAHEKHPNKRIISHFMQPHRPYIGDTATEIAQIAEKNDLDTSITGTVHDTSYDTNNLHNMASFEAYQLGLISRETLRQAYRETLQIVLSYAEKLVEELNGKTVITSDHGDYLGDRPFPYLKRQVGHPYEFTSQLRVVPWLVIQSDRRRRIEAEKPIGFEQPDSETINNRLKALGYL